MTKTQDQAKATLDRLERVGWSSKGAYGVGGVECFMIAMEVATNSECWDEDGLYLDVLRRVAGPVSRDKGRTVAIWNDDPTTRWTDVRDLLLSIIKGEP